MSNLSVINKVIYDVHTTGTQCTVKATLPPGFTMREFTRVFDLRHAPSLDMTEEEYILWNQEQLKQQLMARIHKDDKYMLK